MFWIPINFTCSPATSRFEWSLRVIGANWPLLARWCGWPLLARWCGWSLVAGGCSWGLLPDVAFSVQAQSAAAVDVDERLSSYLERHQLDRLALEQLEQRLAMETDATVRTALQSRMLTLLRKRLLDSQLDPREAQRLAEKAAAELQRTPERFEPGLEIAIAQARFLAAERNYRNWKRVFPRRPAEEQLTHWMEDERSLKQLFNQLSDRQQVLLAAVQSDQRDRNSIGQLEQTESLLAHTRFLLGWTEYFCGVLKPSERLERLRRAETQFRDFLQLEPKQAFVEAPSAWFDFGSTLQVRAIVGLSLCQQGLQRPREGSLGFELIRKNSPPAVRQLVPVWELTGLLNVDQYEAALRSLLEFEQANLKPTWQPAEDLIWQAALVAAAELKSQAMPSTMGLAMGLAMDLASEFRRLGLSGLARNDRAQSIQDAKANTGLELGTDFVGHWAAGVLAWHQTDQPQELDFADDREPSSLRLRQTELLNVARQQLAMALAQDTKTMAPSDRARCQWLSAKVAFRQRAYEEAANGFAIASESLAETDPAAAAETAYWSARALAELSRSDPRQAHAAYASWDRLMRRFPNSRFAVKAQFDQLRLDLNSVPPREAIRRLQEIEPGSPHHTAAQLEVVRHRFQICLEETPRKNARETAREIETTSSALSAQNLPAQNLPTQNLELLRESVRQLNANQATTAEQRLQARLWLINAQLRPWESSLKPTPIVLDTIQAELAAAEVDLELTRNSAVRLEVEAEFHFYRFKLQELQANPQAARRSAMWLIEQGAGSVYELPALIYLARQFKAEPSQSAVLRAAPSNTAELLSETEFQQATRIYQRILDLTAATDEQLKSSANAQFALAQLARWTFRYQQYEAAESCYQRLLGQFPNQQTYLLGLARTKMLRADFANAEPLWGQLSRAAQPATDLWYETKYQWIIAMLETGDPEAQQLYRQTRLLSPQMPEPWRARFDELAKRWQDQ